jgi:PAS domain S-box-containing protein
MTLDVDAGKKPEDQPGYLAQLQATLNVIPAHTWYASPSGGLTFVNKRTADYLGLPKDHPLRFGIDVGAQWDAHLPFVHPDDRAETQENWSTRLRTGEGGEGSFRVRNAQGGYRWFLSRAEPLRASDGTIIQWVGVNLDIEERKYAEEALRESEYKLRQIIETVPGHLWSANPAFEPTHLNRHLLDYFGRRFEDFKEGGWEAFLHPDDLSETAKAISHAVQTGTYFQVVHRLRRADGEFRWHHARGEPLRDQQGRIIQWYGLSVDIDEAKKNEDRLGRSEAYLAEAQRLSHCGVTAYKGSTVFYGSEEIYRIWGFDPAQGVPSRKAVLQRIHPDDRDRLNAEVERALSEKKRYSTAYRIVLPDGTVKHLESIGQPVFSTNGELVEVVATQIDVTERRCAEEALRESEAKFRDYAESASDWYWETDPDHKFTRLTEDERRIARGLATVSRIGVTRWELATDVQSESEKWELHRSMLEARQPFRDFVYRATHTDGSVVYNKISGKPVFDANGEFGGYRGTGTDVTAIARAQKALRESERSARSALDGIAGLVAIMTPNGEVETVNRQCVEYFGRPVDEQKDWVTTDMVHPEDLPQMLENFKRAIVSEIPYHFEQRLRRFDGEYRWFETRGGAVRDDTGSVVRWYVLLTDIEDRVRALARLEQMQADFAHINRVATIGQLTASITHEVNQPITAAVTYALAARRFLSADPPNLLEVDDALSLIVKEGNRAGEVVGRIRALIRKAPARKDAVAINDAILEIIALSRTEAANNSVSVRTQLAEGLSHVLGDRVQLQQVLLNLIINAIEAMRDVAEGERELLISSRNVPDGVSVEVRDSGPGFAPGDIDRVFEAFYSTKSSGVGLGLSICRSIIEAHNGRLWASPNVPRGAVFRFTAPAHPTAAS